MESEVRSCLLLVASGLSWHYLSTKVVRGIPLIGVVVVSGVQSSC